MLQISPAIYDKTKAIIQLIPKNLANNNNNKKRNAIKLNHNSSIINIQVLLTTIILLLIMSALCAGNTGQTRLVLSLIEKQKQTHAIYNKKRNAIKLNHNSSIIKIQVLLTTIIINNVSIVCRKHWSNKIAFVPD